MIKKILKLSILTALSLFVAIQSNTQTVQAAFNKDNLIGDGIFDDSASMNASQIDSFLNSQNSCISPNSGFLAIEPIGYNPTDGFIYGGNVSAGTVIARAAQVYGLNPKVIIATLQKEQSLITSSPTSSNCNTRTISKSMGYACTDTYSPHAYYDLNLYTRNGITYTSVDLTCVESAKKAGFTQQVIRAAWMLKYTQQRSLGNIKWAVISGSWDNSDDLNACYSGPVTEGWRQVCPSGKTVYYDGLMTIDGITIHPNSGATVALYRYTPHFSGNKNFVAIYEGWFGPTQPDVSITSPLRIESIREGYFTNQEIALSFDIVNTASWPMGVGDMMIATRDSKGQNYDFGLQRIVLNPKSSYNYRAKIILPAEETYTFSIANNHDGTWNGDYPQSSYIGNARSVQRFVQAMPTITKSPNLDSAARVGRLMRANFAVKNNSALPLNLGKIGLAMRDASGNNRDLPYEVAGSLAAGQIYEYNEFFAPDKVSHYSASVSVTLDNGATWDNGTFPTSSPSTSRFLDFDVLPNPTLTAGITSSNTALRAGQQTTLTFKVTNFGSQPIDIGKIGMALRSPDGQNYDPRWDSIILQPSQVYTHSVDVVLPKAGEWNIAIGNYNNTMGWNSTYPVSENQDIVRSVKLQVGEGVTISSGVTVSGSLRAGVSRQVSFTIKNYGIKPINIDMIGVAIRGPKGENMDPGWDRDAVIGSGQTYTYSRDIQLQTVGHVHIGVGQYFNSNGLWTMGPPTEGNEKNFLDFDVLPNPTLTAGITSSNTALRAGQQTTLTFKVTNFGSQPIDIGKIGMALRSPDGQNYDPRWDSIILQPSQVYTHSVDVVLPKAGEWNIAIGNYNNTMGWNSTYPVSENQDIVRSVKLQVQ